MQKYLVPVLVLLTPIIFASFTPNLFTTPKLVLVFVITLVMSLIWVSQLAFSKSIHISSSPLKFGLMAFASSIILNLSAYPSGRLESLVGPAAVYLTLCLWAYFLSCRPSLEEESRVVNFSIISSAIIAIHSLLQLTVLYRLTFLPAFMQTRTFTLTGSPLTTFTLLIIGLLASLYFSYLHSKNKTIYLISAVIHGISLISIGYLIFFSKELAPQLLPLKASWNIALDAMKTTKSLIFGVGLSNFGIFYNSVKPLFLNSTYFWNITPQSSGSEVLQILTTTGVLGLATFVLLPLLTLKEMLTRKENKGLVIITLLSAIALVFTPGTLPILVLYFTGLGLLSAKSPHTKSYPTGVSYGIVAVVTLLLAYLSYLAYHVVAAEVSMKQAQVALANNDGKTVYEKSLSSIRHLSGMSSYHLSYSQVNLSLAASLSQKESLSDAEKQNVAQLVAQAVQEAKLSTSLAPYDSSTWQNLGSIYRNLINVADGSDQFSISAYSQAVALDPGNPALRVEFGGLLYQLATTGKKTDAQNQLLVRAQNEFQTAINLKPDYSNAYYNLSKLLETSSDYEGATLTLQKAISLIGPGNPDLARATAELETLKAKQPKKDTSKTETPSTSTSTVEQQSSLSTPTPFPSPISGGPIDLPAQ